jgi:beta-fructofuranosidase
MSVNMPFQSPTYSAELFKGNTVHVWMKCSHPMKHAELFLQGAVSVASVIVDAGYDFRQAEFETTASGIVGFVPAPGTELSLAYAFDPLTVRQEGIRLLFARDEARAASGPRYHFTPPLGWMNDPNGVTILRDELHLFYQHYPHELRWNAMHWGHAISYDGGVTFKHMPIFMQPRSHFFETSGERGGAFSGSAVADGKDGLFVIYTDHQDNRLPDVEVQMLAHAPDGISVASTRQIIDGRPNVLGTRQDFRDPYVFMGPDGLWKMLVGGRDEKGGLVLCYETDRDDEMSDWLYVGILHRSDEPATSPIECPCMLDLGSGLYVLIYSNLQSRDLETGRRNLGRAVVGRYDGKHFAPQHHQELDFGTDAYAFQGTMTAGGPIGIAWAANWTDVVKGRDFPTAMTLVRRLEWRGDHLATPPVADVKKLRGHQIARSLSLGDLLTLPNGTAEITFGIDTANPAFQLTLQHSSIKLALVFDGSFLELIHQPEGEKQGPLYRHATVGLTEIRIFIDNGLIEIYANDGRWCCTKRLADASPVSALKLEKGTLIKVEAWHIPVNFRASLQVACPSVSGNRS